MIRLCRFFFSVRPQKRWVYTHPLDCNPQGPPMWAEWCVYSNTVCELRNAKGTLCKREITAAKASCHSLPFSLCLPSLSPSHTDWWKDSIDIEKETMETRSWCTLNGKALKKKTFIQFSCPARKAHLYCIILNYTSYFDMAGSRKPEALSLHHPIMSGWLWPRMSQHVQNV